MRTFKPIDVLANRIARAVGAPLSTIAAVIAVLLLALAGPFFHFSTSWQLVVNTFTTLVTFLMVFLIQHTQNGDTAALHIKLNELITVMAKADNSLLDLEHADHGQIESLSSNYRDVAERERGGVSHTEHAQRTKSPRDKSTE